MTVCLGCRSEEENGRCQDKRCVEYTTAEKI